MTTNVISLEEALAHLEKRIPDTTDGKKEIIDLLNWIITWNKDRSPNNQVFSFLREFEDKNKSERVNVAFALDRNGNRAKKNKPNFVVIKLTGTDKKFKDTHTDFDLTDSGYPPLSKHLNQRSDNIPRWVALGSEISKMGLDNFRQLFLVAYGKKGGVA